jgi:hypothetical protein
MGVVLADAAYGNGTQFRAAISELGLQYAVASNLLQPFGSRGSNPYRPRRRSRAVGATQTTAAQSTDHLPVSAKQLALGLPSAAWKDIGWRQGSKGTLRSRFAAVRVRPAHRDYKRTEPHPEEWLLIEWPKNESEPTKYWLSTLPDRTSLKSLVKIAKHRWIIERDYEELKQELGLGHYEGRGWRGFHHHATLCIAAYGFLVSERSRFSPSARAGHVGLRAPKLPRTSGREDRRIRPERHNPQSIATLRIIIARYLVGQCCLTVPAAGRGADDRRRRYPRHYAVCRAGMIRGRPPRARSSLTSLSSSNAMHRQFDGDPGGPRPLSLSPPY